MMKTTTSKTKGNKSRPKTKLGTPDMEHSKAAVLRSLDSPDSKRGYQHAIDEFVAWYCSEPRLAFNRTVVLRYRFHLEERGLAPGMINVRMAAVRRLASEAADCGPLSPELVAGIHRVKGIRKLVARETLARNLPLKCPVLLRQTLAIHYLADLIVIFTPHR
jgi:hypothetical protein